MTMTNRSLIAILVVVQLASPLAIAQGNDTSDLAINVVSAEDLGCSDDGSLAGPGDLRVTVSVDGHQRLQTVKAQDQEAPEYAAFTVVEAVELPATIHVVIEEAEPGGFFGMGTSWETCDASPDASTTYEATWEGDQQEIVARGGGDRPAEAIVVLGPEAPDRPVLTEQATGTDQATLTWDTASADEITGHRLRWAPVGEVFHESGPEAGEHTVEDLCDNTPYTFQVLRDADPWHIASEPLEVTTQNKAPFAPVVLQADKTDGNLTVAWLMPTSHDLATIDLHAGTASTFQPDETTRLETYRGPFAFQPVEVTVTDPPQHVTHLRVTVTDTGGLSATSEAFAIGDEPTDPQSVPESEDAECPGAADRIGHTATLDEARPDEDGQPPAPPSDDTDPAEPTPQGPNTEDPFPPDGEAQPTQDGQRASDDSSDGIGVWIGLLAGIALTLAVVAIVLVLTGRA